MTRVVTIVQRRLTHYRVAFFEGLRDSLAREGVNLRLLHGTGTAREAQRRDKGSIAWAESLETRYFLDGKLCWQPFSHAVGDTDLLVLTQENALLANHLALLSRPVERVAFWGHGANLQGNNQSLSERFKRWGTRRVHWYFAYTHLSVDLVAGTGFPSARITCLNNAVDTGALVSDLASVSEDDLANMRATFGLGEGPVGLFLGSLHAHKKLDFLLAAAGDLRKRIEGFQLLVVGDGEGRAKIEAAAATCGWIRYAGARGGRDKAGALKLATIIMNPGLVGLGILDSFAAGVPMVTTDCGLHSPEIAYLTPDNGVMSGEDLGSYVAACARLLSDQSERVRLAAGCQMAAKEYTLPNMVENFTQGVLRALEVPR